MKTEDAVTQVKNPNYTALHILNVCVDRPSVFSVQTTVQLAQYTVPGHTIILFPLKFLHKIYRKLLFFSKTSVLNAMWLCE